MAFEKKGRPPAYQPLKPQYEDILTQRQPVMFLPAQPVGQQVFVMSTNNKNVPAQQVFWMPTQPTGVYVRRPQTFVPNSHLVLTVILFVVLTIFAPETLIFMIPALVMSIMSHTHNERGNYGQAKCLGNGALAFNFVGLISAFVVAILAIALSFSLYPWSRSQDYYNAYWGCYYDYSVDLGSGFEEYPMICY